MTNYQETNEITEVQESEDYYFLSQGGMSCGLKKKYGFTPKKGDILTVHTMGGTFGTIRGMDLNGVSVFWFTDEQMEESRQKSIRESEERKIRTFEIEKDSLDEKYSNLPKCFQERIDRFRTNNPNFRVDFESYEIFCCEQAVLIAESCKSKEEVEKFSNESWENQIKQVKGLSLDHSGNTFGCACRLAYYFLDNSENVVKLHGALSPLVGSESYGDIAIKL